MSIKSITKTVISAGDVANNLESEWIDLRFNYGFAVQCTLTGSPTGAVVIYGSNDQSALTQISSLTVSGTNVLALNQDAIYWPYIIIKKASGGTGTLTVKITIKGA